MQSRQFAIADSAFSCDIYQSCYMRFLFLGVLRIIVMFDFVTFVYKRYFSTRYSGEEMTILFQATSAAFRPTSIKSGDAFPVRTVIYNHWFAIFDTDHQFRGIIPATHINAYHIIVVVNYAIFYLLKEKIKK